MIYKIPGGTYSDDPHEYFDESGRWVPSLTQCGKLSGMVQLYGDADVVANAARRGSEVHKIAGFFNRFREIDETWLTEENGGYFAGYQQFLKESGFVPDPAWVETPMVVNIHGFPVGVTPDVFGTFTSLRVNAVIELKTVASPQPFWAVQTAIQEVARYKSKALGHVRRHSLILFKDARYKLLPPYENPHDLDDGIAMLRTVHWRLRNGHNLRQLATAN